MRARTVHAGSTDANRPLAELFNAHIVRIMQSDARNPEVQNRYNMILERGGEAAAFTPQVSFSGHEANPLFHNDGRSLVEIGATTGLSRTEDGRGFVLVDLDEDGALDVVLRNNTARPLLALLNRAAEGSAWIRLRLRGTKSNRFGIGARVTVNGRVQELHAGTGYLSGNAPELHFGLGAAEKADVKIRWPSGREDLWAGLPANRRATLTEGDSVPRLEAPKRIALAVESPPAPSGGLVDPRAILGRLANPDGTAFAPPPLPVILVFFRVDCVACNDEFQASAESEAAAEAAGARILWVSADSDPARVREAFSPSTGSRLRPLRASGLPAGLEVPTVYLVTPTGMEKFTGRHAVTAAIEGLSRRPPGK